VQGNKNSPPYFDDRRAITKRLREDHCYSATVWEYNTYQRLHDSALPHGQALPKQVRVSKLKRSLMHLLSLLPPESRQM
jgi:hypothetical protein